MKRVLTLLLTASVLCPAGLFAQQKAMVEQIAALQVYLGWLKKGNNILKDGTGLISSIKNGDFKLHSGHFDSLKRVNPGIRGSDKVKAIIHMHDAMARARPLMIRKARGSRRFSGPELKDLEQHCADLAVASGKDLDELLLIITPGKVSMTDDERIRIIERLYTSMQDKYSAQRRLNAQVKAEADNRGRATKDAGTLRELYDL